MKVIGFTGTRWGLTRPQEQALKTLLKAHAPERFHHGDCVGADCEAASLVERYLRGCQIVCHPPSEKRLRAFSSNWHRIMPPKEYHERNRDIVEAAEAEGTGGLVLACPANMKYTAGSGTWATALYAERAGVTVQLVFPDGTTECRVG